MKRIVLEDITKSYGAGAAGVVAVERLSLSVEPGEFFFLLGPSGCGKTTLLRMIAGLTDPTSGRVLLGGRDVTGEAVERRNTALVFQNYALWPHMTVRENVEFGPKMRGLSRRAARRAAECLDLVEMGSLAGRKPNQLSGGQQQRVALARALAAEPDCLLLDEPLSNLDAKLRLHMRRKLRGLVKATGTTAVYVTHDQKEAMSMADRVAVMDAGRVVQVGTPEEIYNEPASRFVADFLGEANFVEGTVGGVGAAPGAARIETSVGTILATPRRCPPAGTRVICCVRPERIGLGGPDEPPGADGVTALAATVVDCTYLGEIRQYVCELAEGARWKISVLAGREGGIDPGRAVCLRIGADDVAVLPA